MIIRITESQYDEIINDPLFGDYNVFSIDSLKSGVLKSGKDICAYCRQCGLSEIGRGTGRTVFGLDDNTVLKVVNNNYDNQNEGEVMAYRRIPDELKWFVPKILDYDKNSLKPLWIISERVLRARKVDFLKILGMEFGEDYQNEPEDVEQDLETYSEFPTKQSIGHKFELTDFLVAYERVSDGYANDVTKERFEEYRKYMDKSKWLRDLYTLLRQGIVYPDELTLISNWGLVIRNGKPTVIILDSGI